MWKDILWIMSTLLENDNNIILWESELWVLYLKITIILFYEKVWNDFIVSTSLYDLKVLVPLAWLTMDFHPPLKMWQISILNSCNATSTMGDDVIYYNVIGWFL